MTNKPLTQAAEVLRFFFGDNTTDTTVMHECIKRWFETSLEFDQLVRARCGALVEQALAGALDDWARDMRNGLALVLLLDQMPRNCYRGRKEAFDGDAKARLIAGQLLKRQDLARLSLFEQAFLYMPFEHSEDLNDQQYCVAGYLAIQAQALPTLKQLLAQLVAAGKAHREVIQKFGRFPHRNAALGRTSTAEELAWYADNDHGWGQSSGSIKATASGDESN